MTTLRDRAMKAVDRASQRKMHASWAFVDMGIALVLAIIAYVDQFTCWGDE